MPYILPEDRELFDPLLDPLLDTMFKLHCGDLNYIITKLVHHWVDEQGVNYATYNNAVGVLECAKQELLRQHVGPYEEKKREANGKIGVLD